MASSADQRIKVGIRVRSLTGKEKDRNKQLQWQYLDNQIWQIDPQTEKKMGNSYTFDYVFGMDSSSKSIFDDLVKPIVESSVKGFNGTIFAYGQTSSGKTYTMLGEKSEEGIIPLSVKHVFSTAESYPDREYLIRVSYMEIYNEKIHDLLEGQNNLKIHEDSSGNAYVILKEDVVDCPEKVMAAMKKGEKMRRTGVTDINEKSSRSHAIFRITIESRKQLTDMSTNENYSDDAVHVSHLNLIDLAGSERVFQTKATGDRFKEGCAINKSLFHLGKVISQLSEGSGQYVNFRDSKLTRILESSLGGNALTAIICTVTPASAEETASTLSFASRANCVTNSPHLNEIVSDECLIRRHAALVKKLEMELEKAKQDNDCESMKKELEQKEKIICQLKDWIKRDELIVYSPRLVSRSERRKTWAASDLAASLQRAKLFQPEDLNTLHEEEFGSGTMAVDSPSSGSDIYENEKATEFGLRGQKGCGIWNKENHPLQHARYSWHTPLLKNSGKEPRRGSQGGKKRKSAVGEFSSTEDLSLQLIERDHMIRSLESVVEELKLKLNGVVEEKGISSNEPPSQLTEALLPDDNCSRSNISSGTSEILHSSLQKAEVDLQLKIESLEASLEKEKLKVESLEASLKEEKLKVGSLEVSFEEERLKVESLESSLQKQAKEMEELILRESELITKMAENDALALSDKRALLSEIEVMLGEKKEANSCEIDLLLKVKHQKESQKNLEMKIQESNVLFNSLTLAHDGLNSALISEKLCSNEATKQLKHTLESISNISRELASLSRKSDDMAVVVADEASSLDENALSSNIVLQNLTEVINELKSFFIKEILDLGTQADGLSAMTVKMGEEISALKMHFENILIESDDLKAERSEFESLLNKEKETIQGLQAQLQSSLENGVSLSRQVNELLEQLQYTEKGLNDMRDNRMEVETDMLDNMSRINELEEELQAKEVVIANLAESDEDNLIELRELTNQRDRLKEELVDAQENLKSLLVEVMNIKENSVPLESLDAMKSDNIRLSAECERYQLLLNTAKEAYDGLELRNVQVLKDMNLLIEERNTVVAESEEVRSANSRGYNELMLVQEALQEKKNELSNLAEDKEILTLNFTKEKNKNDLLQSSMNIVAQENESLLKELEGLRQICDKESDQLEVISTLQNELEQVKFTLSVCTESEKELDNLLTTAKEDKNSLNNQLVMAVTEKEDVILKYEEFQRSLGQLENKLKLSEEEKIELVNNTSQLILLNEELTENINMLKDKIIGEEQCYIGMENEFKSQIEGIENENRKKADEIVLLNSKNSELCLLLDSKNETICALESNIAKLNEELSSYTNEINACRIIISQLQDELIATQERNSEDAAHLRQKLEEEMKEKLSEMTAARETIEGKLKINSEEASAERDSNEKFISSLRKQLEEADAKYALISTQNDERICVLQHELQLEIEKFNLKLQEMESMSSVKIDVETKLQEMSSEKEKLLMELEKAEERMQSMKNENTSEMETERCNYEQSISSLQKQLQDTNEEFDMIMKQKDEKISSMQHELQLEIEKFNLKLQEMESMSSVKIDVEAKLEVMSSEKEKLYLELQMAEEKMRNMKIETTSEMETERSNYEHNISSLQKQLLDANDEFEVISKQKDEKISSLQHELQLEIEKFNLNLQEMESMSSVKIDVETKLQEMSSEKEKLLMELEKAEGRMRNMKNENTSEMETERSNYEHNISSLQKQLQDTNEEFDMIMKQKDEKISSLQHELQLEIEKFNLKLQEMESMSSVKLDVEEKLQEMLLEKEKLLLELEMAEEKMRTVKNENTSEMETERNNYGENISCLQKQLQDINEEFEVIMKQKDEKISSLQHELQLEIEKFNLKLQELESMSSVKIDVEEKLQEMLLEKEKLLMELEMADEKMRNVKNENSSEMETQRNNYGENISCLQKQLQDTNEEFEVIMKQKDEKISSLQHELQLEIEKFNLKLQELESMSSVKIDVEEKLEVMSSEKEKLLMELEMADEKMRNMKNESTSEMVTERCNYEQSISSLQKQLQDINEEFDMIMKQKDEKISSMQHELQLEIEKFNLKLQEMESMSSVKIDVETKLQEMSSEKEKLSMELEKAEERMQSMKNENTSEMETERCNYEQSISSLQKQLQDTNEEFDMIMKQKDEKISSMQHELQLEIEKFNLKLQEMESLSSVKSDVEAKLEEISSEKKKLCLELETAEERIRNMKNENTYEMETERNNYEDKINSLQKQLQEAKEEFKMNLREKDEEIISLDNKILSETIKNNEKVKEFTHMQSLKEDLEKKIEQFSLEEQKYLAAEKKLAAEEMRTELLEKRLEDLNKTYAANVEELNRLKHLEHDHQADLEKMKKHTTVLENSHELTKRDFSLAQSDKENLKSEISSLKGLLLEETNMKQQLSVQLTIAQEGRLAALAAEEKILVVLGSQEKIMAVLETTTSDLKEKLKSKSESCSDLKKKCQNLESKLAESESSTKAELLHLKQENEELAQRLTGFSSDHQQKPNEEMLNTLHLKEQKLNELQEKYLERDEYAKRMDQWAVKMEKRVNTADDYRLEIQQKAKATEAELRLKINQLKTENERLGLQTKNPEPAKCNCLQNERDLKREKEEKEALKLKVDEYNRIIGCGGRYESTHIKRPEMSDSGVQTTSVEVVDIDPNGCGVVQLCKVDVLNQMVNKLKKDKEDLKQICRRRHNQREELKLQLEEMKIKLQTLESQVHKK